MRDILPNGSSPVYPGHPITTAWFIVNKYPSFETASERRPEHDYMNALEDNDIPGAGSEVHAALEFLGKLNAGGLWGDAVKWADDHWSYSCAGGHGRKVAPGQTQANYVKPLLFAKRGWWEDHRSQPTSS